MFETIRKRASYANVAATLALAVAVGGGTASALQGRNSVFSNDIAPNEVRGKDVKESSLKLPRVVVEDPSSQSQSDNELVLALAECPAGFSVTGGGFSRNSYELEVHSSYPITIKGVSYWTASGESSAAGQSITAYAVCTRGPLTDLAN